MIKNYSRSIRELLCYWCLLVVTSGVSLACENIEFVSGRDANLANFDTFSKTPSKLTHALQFNVEGDCQSLEVAVGNNENKSTQFPLIYIHSGTREVYNSSATPANREKIVLDNLQNPISIPLTIYIESDRILSPNLIRKKISLFLTGTNSQGDVFNFQEDLELNLFVKGSLSASLSGAKLSSFSQHYNLDLGNLRLGKSDKTLMFNVQSNQKYELKIRSKNQGKLVLESTNENIQRSTLSYQLIVDNQLYDLMNDSLLLENASYANKIAGNQHSLQLIIQSDPRKARAGRYKDTIIINIAHGL